VDDDDDDDDDLTSNTAVNNGGGLANSSVNLPTNVTAIQSMAGNMMMLKPKRNNLSSHLHKTISHQKATVHYVSETASGRRSLA